MSAKKESSRRKSGATAAQLAAIKFPAVDVKAENFTSEWDHSRGLVARMAAVLAGYDDTEMTRRFLKSEETAHGLMDMHDMMMNEIDYLKVHSEILNAVCTRILCVAHRYKEPKAKA